MKNIVWKYGLISGGIAAVLMSTMALYTHKDPARFENGEVFGYIGILLSMLLVYFGARAYRDQVEGGTISFGKAFQVGLLICIISCACYVLAWMGVSHLLMPDFMDHYIAYYLEKMKSSGATPEAIAEKAAEMAQFKELYKNPVVAAGVTFLEPFPVGLLVTAASAGLLRKKK